MVVLDLMEAVARVAGLVQERIAEVL